MKKGKRIIEKNTKVKRKMSYEEQEKKKKIIVRTFIIIVALIVLFVIAMIANNYIILDNNEVTNLVINNRNVTSDLKNNVLIENNVIYLSEDDVQNFFDKYLYLEEENNKFITTYDKKIAEIGFDEDEININGSDKQIYAHVINKDGINYLPVSEMKDVYNIEIENIEDTKVVTMDSLDREQKKAVVTSNVAVKSSTNFIARTVDRLEKGETVVVISSENGISRVRTPRGKIGYIKTNKLDDEFTVREALAEEKQIDGKVNLTWDYYSMYGEAPDRSGTTIEGVNVVSPAFFHLSEDGLIDENVGQAGENYVEWAHGNNYRVWPMISNAEIGMDVTSEVMNSYAKRKALIEELVNVCVKYDLDGINVDFENMKQEDIDLYSRFIIELTPRLKEIGAVTSVDVTAPDGAETWSLCFDRHVLGDVADYLIFMAYDQYGASSNIAGSTAAYDWVKVNLDKFIKNEEVDKEKLILAVPLYTRLWTTDGEENVLRSPSTVTMNDINDTIPEGVERTWLEDERQNYIEYEEDGNIRRMWIEDIDSLREKVSLINEYELAGVASWELGMETEDVWQMFQDELN